MSELSYRVIAHSVIPNFVWDECVDWAYEMLLLGYDTPNLVMLAGIVKPTNSFEVLPYLNAAFAESGIEEKKGEEAIVFYASFFIKGIATGTGDVGRHLVTLRELFHECGMPSAIRDLWLLSFAWSDFFEFDGNHTWYWEGATKENIRQIVVESASQWLKGHENQLLL